MRSGIVDFWRKAVVDMATRRLRNLESNGDCQSAGVCKSIVGDRLDLSVERLRLPESDAGHEPR